MQCFTYTVIKFPKETKTKSQHSNKHQNMPRRCFVKNCKNVARYQLPTNDTLRQEWIKELQLDQLKIKTSHLRSRSGIICSAHFEPDDFTFYITKTGKYRKRLKTRAIPSLNDGPKKNPEEPILFKANNLRTYSKTDRVPQVATKEDSRNDEVWIDEDYSLIKGDPDSHETHGIHDIQEIHNGYRCNVCNTEIIGFRYVCVECADFDLCGACEAARAHSAHYVLRVPAPRPASEVEAVLRTIRRALLMNVPGDTQHEPQPVQVKEEPEYAEVPIEGPDPYPSDDYDCHEEKILPDLYPTEPLMYPNAPGPSVPVIYPSTTEVKTSFKRVKVVKILPKKLGTKIKSEASTPWCGGRRMRVVDFSSLPAHVRLKMKTLRRADPPSDAKRVEPVKRLSSAQAQLVNAAMYDALRDVTS